MNYLEDEEIVELYCMRSELALEATQRKYSGKVYRYLLRILWDMEDAKECMNDTFFALWQRVPETVPRHLEQYVLHIARNIAIDNIRRKNAKKRRAVFTEYNEGIVCPYGNMCDVTIYEFRCNIRCCIRAFLYKQSKIRRKIFVLHYCYNMPINKLAIINRISPGCAKMTLFRMRENLKKELNKEGICIIK